MRALIIVAAIVAASPAAAQQACMDGKAFFAKARQQFGEHMTSFGIAGDGRSRLIVMTSRQGGWTLASINGHGVVCVMAAGTDWQDAPLPKEEGNDL